MIIKDFCRVATSEGWKLRGIITCDGVCVVMSSGAEMIQTQRGKTRFWKSVDVLLKHLDENGFSGVIEFEIQQR